MPRIKVSVPDHFLFSMERSVGISDVNYAKHLDSVAMVKILHEARLQFLASLGFTEGNIFGLGMVVTDLEGDCRAGSVGHGSVVRGGGGRWLNRYGFGIGLQVTNSALDAVVCNAKMGVVFFDFDRHKITELPPAFKAILEQPESRVA